MVEKFVNVKVPDTIKASVVRENYTQYSRTWYYTFDKSHINQGRYLSYYAYEDDNTASPFSFTHL